MRSSQTLFTWTLLTALTLAAGCSSLGAHQINREFYDYNESIHNAAKQQLLLNIVRLRYSDAPRILRVAEVATKYTRTVNANVESSITSVDGHGRGGTLVPGNLVASSLNRTRTDSNTGLGKAVVGVSYLEEPLVTYKPLSGDELASVLTSAINPVFPGSDEQGNSVWTAMKRLADSIEVPDSEIGLTTSSEPIHGISIKSAHQDLPTTESTFVRVKYNGVWYYITNNDVATKTAFSRLLLSIEAANVSFEEVNSFYVR